MSVCFNSGLHFAGSREDRKMKTLLLTLVVVTIVCLDFGYTLTCKTCPFNTCADSETCPVGKDICYQRKWNEHSGKNIERGCVANCPELGSHDTFLLCCRRDNCN